jgi:demethylspheroidene O-methyltransferase
MKTLDIAKPLLQGTPRASWRDSLDALLDRWMTSDAVYRWAASNPLTRWIVQRRAQQVFDLMAGFVYSQVLLACVRLRIFELVAEAPRSLDELAQKCQVPASALQRLLESAKALRLLEQRSHAKYGLGPLGGPIAGHAGIRAMIEHHAVLYQDMQDPVALLKDQLPDGAAMAQYWPYAANEAARDGTRKWQPDMVSRYSDLMSASQPFVVDEVLASYPFEQHRCSLDVGGGQGTFVSKLARHAPHLQLRLFDLPQVAGLARDNFAKLGLTERVEAFGGDFLRDALPRGADLITLVRVAHDHPDADVKTILRSIHQALPVGGTLLLAEPMAQAPGQAPLGDAYFHFYLLAMGSGRLRSVQELMDMMAEAGFSHIESVPNPMPLQTRILVGRKSRDLP